MAQNAQIQQFQSVTDFRKVLADQYQKQIVNFLGDEKKALRFLSSVVASVQRNPKLLECDPATLLNSFITMAQLELMPSDVSGEAYVIPYNNSKNVGGKWIKVQEAQFQLGYQGLVTLFYRAGIKKVVSEIVYEKDEFDYTNGEVTHKPDVFADDRGEPRGAYVIITLPSGEKVAKVMSAKQIMTIASTFSKSFQADEKKKSPWHIENDPELWMWRKTVLKQAGKLVPKNEKLITAIAEDNKDSVIGDRLEEAKGQIPSLTMGHIATETYDESAQTDEDQAPDSEGDDQAAGDGYKA